MTIHPKCVYCDDTPRRHSISRKISTKEKQTWRVIGILCDNHKHITIQGATFQLVPIEEILNAKKIYTRKEFEDIGYEMRKILSGRETHSFTAQWNTYNDIR